MKLTILEKKELERYFKEFDFKNFFDKKTFLITGSNGLIGTGLIKWLLHYANLQNLRIKIIASTRNPNKKPNFIDDGDPIRYCKFGEERQFVQTETVDYIIHAAAPTGRAFFMANPVNTLKIIVDETEKMLDLCLDKHARMLYLSSVEAYGTPDIDGEIDETYYGAVDSLNIRNGYPIGKKAAEFLCVAYHHQYNLDVSIVRPSSIQGLFQPYTEQRIFNELLRCICENKNITMKSDGLSKKSIIYTLDAISGIFSILFKGKAGEAYNLTNPDTFMTMKELSNLLFQNFNDKLRIVYDIKETSETGYLPHLSFTQNVEKLKKLGWKPITNLTEIYKIDIKRFKNEN